MNFENQFFFNYQVGKIDGYRDPEQTFWTDFTAQKYNASLLIHYVVHLESKNLLIRI